MKHKQKTFMLVLDRDDPKKEFEFEVAYALTLSVRQRYKKMEMVLKIGKEFRKKKDRKIAPSIFART